jgi:hypothetical protein
MHLVEVGRSLDKLEFGWRRVRSTAPGLKQQGQRNVTVRFGVKRLAVIALTETPKWGSDLRGRCLPECSMDLAAMSTAEERDRGKGGRCLADDADWRMLRA